MLPMAERVIGLVTYGAGYAYNVFYRLIVATGFYGVIVALIVVALTVLKLLSPVVGSPQSDTVARLNRPKKTSGGNGKRR